MLSQEEQLLVRFFEAARLHDTTVLAQLATITFNPKTEGVVEDFQVDAVEALDDGSKHVTVVAQVRQPDGQTAPRTMQVTMQRQDERWLITEIR